VEREVSPAVWIAALVVALLTIGWIGWRTLVPHPPMSREEYIQWRNNARTEIIQRYRRLPVQRQ
jgi:hypothetical protein